MGDDMAAESAKTQCEIFAGAGWIVAPHGGHFGNIICARRGTVIVEMACAGSIESYSMKGRPFLVHALDWNYTYLRPTGCLWFGRNSDFNQDVRSLAWLIPLARNRNAVARPNTALA